MAPSEAEGRQGLQGDPDSAVEKLHACAKHFAVHSGTERNRHQFDAQGPIKTLRGFQRVEIPAGATVNVTFPLTADTFIWWSEEAQDMVPLRGEYKLLFGGDSQHVKALDYKY